MRKGESVSHEVSDNWQRFLHGHNDCCMPKDINDSNFFFTYHINIKVMMLLFYILM